MSTELKGRENSAEIEATESGKCDWDGKILGETEEELGMGLEC